MTIYEKDYGHWTKISIVLSLVTIILFITQMQVNDVLSSGYLRIAAFITFASAIFSIMKTRFNSHQIQMDIKNRRLNLNFVTNGETVLEEQLTLDTIQQLEIDYQPFKFLPRDFILNDLHLKYRSKKDGEFYGLFDINRRQIPLTKEEVKKTVQFFLNENPDIQLVEDDKQFLGLA